MCMAVQGFQMGVDPPYPPEWCRLEMATPFPCCCVPFVGERYSAQDGLKSVAMSTWQHFFMLLCPFCGPHHPPRLLHPPDLPHLVPELTALNNNRTKTRRTEGGLACRTCTVQHRILHTHTGSMISPYTRWNPLLWTVRRSVEMIGRKTTPIHTCRPCTHSSHTQGSGDLIVMMCRVWPNHP